MVVRAATRIGPVYNKVEPPAVVAGSVPSVVYKTSSTIVSG